MALVEDGWAEFIEGTRGRPAMPFLGLALDFVNRPPGLAVELGAGSGVETRALLQLGWRVHAIDGDSHSAAVQTWLPAPHKVAREAQVTVPAQPIMPSMKACSTVLSAQVICGQQTVPAVVLLQPPM